MNGVCLRFYAAESRRVKGKLFYEWLLEQARELGIPGGTAFKAIAGFGRHGVMHEAKFFELAGDLTIEVEFMVSEAEADKLLEAVRAARVHASYVRFPAEIGVLDGEGP